MTKTTRLITAAMLALSVAGLTTGSADARRGGSFGSRGSRTYSAPRQTYGSGYVSPIQRSTTPAYGGSTGYRPSYGQNRPYGYGQSGGGFGVRRPGFGTGLVGGLLAGGLVGSMFGHSAGYGGGYGGGGGGGLAWIFQLLVLGGLGWLAYSFFRRRSNAAPGGGYNSNGFASNGYAPTQPQTFGSATVFGGAAPAATGAWGGAPADDGDIQLTAADQATFEHILKDVQAAYSREDVTSLRNYCTGEVVDVFRGEIADNVAQGVRNDVTGVDLLSAEVSEAWRENGVDYATVALRYQSTDVMRDRTTGQVRSGDVSPTQTIEYWTFRRDATATWKLSAVQDA